MSTTMALDIGEEEVKVASLETQWVQLTASRKDGMRSPEYDAELTNCALDDDKWRECMAAIESECEKSTDVRIDVSGKVVCS